MYYGKSPLVVTGNKVLGIDDLNQLIYVKGTGAITLTLPDLTGNSGYYWINVFNAANQDLTITVPTALLDTLVGVNGLGFDTVAVTTASQKIGAFLHLFFFDGRWNGVGATAGITFTYAS